MRAGTSGRRPATGGWSGLLWTSFLLPERRSPLVSPTLLWSLSPGCCPGLPQVDPAGRTERAGRQPAGDMRLGAYFRVGATYRRSTTGEEARPWVSGGSPCRGGLRLLTVVEDGPSDDPVSGWPWAVFGLAASADFVRQRSLRRCRRRPGTRSIVASAVTRVSAARYACRRIAVAGFGCHA